MLLIVELDGVIIGSLKGVKTNFIFADISMWLLTNTVNIGFCWVELHSPCMCILLAYIH